MKARIHDYRGRLAVEITPEDDDERLLLRAFIREHRASVQLFVDCVEDECNALKVTFGEKPFQPAVHTER